MSANGSFSIGGPSVGLLHINGKATFVYNDVFGWVDSYELISGRVTDICTLID